MRRTALRSGDREQPVHHEYGRSPPSGHGTNGLEDLPVAGQRQVELVGQHARRVEGRVGFGQPLAEPVDIDCGEHPAPGTGSRRGRDTIGAVTR